MRQATENNDKTLENAILSALLQGKSLQEFASEAQLTPAELARRVNLPDILQKAEGLARLQGYFEQIRLSNQRVKSITHLERVMHHATGYETRRRACKTLMQGFRKEGTRGRPDTRARQVGQWLRETLAHGPRPAAEVRQLAHQRGIPRITLKRAKQKAGVLSIRHGFGRGGRFLWGLADARTPKPRRGWHTGITSPYDIETRNISSPYAVATDPAPDNLRPPGPPTDPKFIREKLKEYLCRLANGN